MRYFNVKAEKEVFLDVKNVILEPPSHQGLKEILVKEILKDVVETPFSGIIKKDSPHRADCVDFALGLVTMMVYELRSFYYKSCIPNARILLTKEFHSPEKVTYGLKILGRRDPLTNKPQVIKDLGDFKNT